MRLIDYNVVQQHSEHTGMITGTGGDDPLVHHRDPDMASHAGTGLSGFAGNDTLEASVPNMGQIHMYAGIGDDLLILDVTKIENAMGTQGHHAYGGHGADTFEFVNVSQCHSPIVGRLDDFDPSVDKIMIEGIEIDLMDLPQTITLPSGESIFVRVVEIEHPEFADERLGTQQFLAIGDNIFYALEGARDLSNGISGMTGEERHFLHPDALDALRSAEPVLYDNPHNFVPNHLYNYREAELELFWAPSGSVIRIASDPDNPVHVFGGKTNSLALSSKGAQVIHTGSGNDVIDANTGNDTVFANAGNDLVSGGIDNDRLFGQAGDDSLWGGDGDDTLVGGVGNDFCFGGNGDDSLLGGKGNDYLKGEEGDDTIRGGNGNDEIDGGWGRDSLNGGAGQDTIYGHDGNDHLAGGLGPDLLEGGHGNDTLFGGAHDDTLYGGSGADQLIGGKGSDFMRGGADEDTVLGGSGNDTLGGDRGNDLLIGGAGNDHIFGGDDDDTLLGGPGDDSMSGGHGNDRIIAGPGDDTVRGSTGADTFAFRDGDDTLVIEDFRMRDDDLLELDNELWTNTHGQLSIEEVLSIFGSIIDGDLILDFGQDTIILEGVNDINAFSSHVEIG